MSSFLSAAKPAVFDIPSTFSIHSFNCHSFKHLINSTFFKTSHQDEALQQPLVVLASVTAALAVPVDDSAVDHSKLDKRWSVYLPKTTVSCGSK